MRAIDFRWRCRIFFRIDRCHRALNWYSFISFRKFVQRPFALKICSRKSVYFNLTEKKNIVYAQIKHCTHTSSIAEIEHFYIYRICVLKFFGRCIALLLPHYFVATYASDCTAVGRIHNTERQFGERERERESIGKMPKTIPNFGKCKRKKNRAIFKSIVCTMWMRVKWLLWNVYLERIQGLHYNGEFRGSLNL